MDSAEGGEVGVGGGDGVGEDDVGLAAKLVEHLGEGEDGADGVTVGASVRGEEEAGMGPEDCEQIVNPGYVGLRLEELCLRGHDLGGAPGTGSEGVRFCSRLRVRARSSSMRPVIFSDRSMAKLSSGTWRTPMRSRSWERM